MNTASISNQPFCLFQLKQDLKDPTVAPAGFRITDLIRQLLKNIKLQDAIPEYIDHKGKP